MKLFNIICVGVNKRFDTRRKGQLLATLVLLLLFHTEFVFTVCPENCLSCTDQTNCTKCKSKKWGTGLSQCLTDCSKDCLNGECLDDTGYCLNCEPGKYGRFCQHNCSDCKNDHCDLYRCVEGCKSGYFEYQTSYTYFCQKCPTNCKQCDNGNVCRICNDGFYSHQHYYNGNTYVKCNECLNENTCSNLCLIQGCIICEVINNKPMCADCSERETFNGVSCEQITNKCSQGCSTDCDSNGICLGNCNDGWTGDSCAEKCHAKCLICSKNDSTICIRCNGDFYSTDCSLACSKSCLKTEGKNACNIDNGFCLNGCERGFWDDTCNNSCPSGCKDHDCDRSTGTCTRGCKDGYSGDKCGPTTTINQKGTPVTTITAKTTHNQASEVKIFIFGLFSGIGISVVILAIATVLYFVRRRYLGNKTPQNNSRNVEIPTYIETTNNYESLSHNRNRDNVYSDLGTRE